MKTKIEKQVKNKKKNLIFIVLVLILLAVVILVNQAIIKINNTAPEIKRAKTYGELTENDYKTQSDNVEFSAFFTRDLNNDGYAERIKGTCKEIGTKDDLYAELKVSSEGQFKNGTITLDAKNFSWETSIIGDSIVDGNYIGTNTNEIKLKESVSSGSQKLFFGKINSKIGNNINDYSQISSMTLKGTYVDSEGHETEINVTRQLNVDWYGDVETYINSNSTANVEYVGETELEDDKKDMQISFGLETKERLNKLILKENVVSVTIPEVYGYKAKKVEVTNNNVNYEYNDDTGILTITNTSELDKEGNIIKTLSSTNIYNIVLTYPPESHSKEINDQKLNFSMEFPVTSIYRGYNNQNKEFENIKESKKDGITVATGEKGYYSINDEMDICIGEEPQFDKVRSPGIISKEKAIQKYNLNDDVKEDYYKVRWYQGVRYDGNKILKETKADEIIDTNGNHYPVTDFVDNIGIYFENVSVRNAQIKVYNDETNELIHTFNATEAGKYTKNNPYKYDGIIKKIRVEIEGAVGGEIQEDGNRAIGDRLEIVQIKEIDDDALVKKFSREEFDKFKFIYSYFDATNDGGTSKLSAYAKYVDKESDVRMSLSKKDMITIDKEIAETITIQTKAEQYYQKGWKNGQFLVKLPKDIIYAEINDIATNNSNVKILSYSLYKEENNYFLKILTENETDQLYDIKVNCKLVLNPIATTQEEKFELYGYNEGCSEYYNSTKDIYDVNSNNNKEETVALYASYVKVRAPNSLITSQTITNYDETGSETIAPNIADVRKEKRTADINVKILNNYNVQVSETKILGTIPYKDNTQIENDESLGSQFTTTMSNTGVIVPNNLKNIVTVYYTENGKATKDLENEENGWTTEPTDWTKVKRYLIDFKDYSIPTGASYTFTYTVQIPEDIEYNKIAYSGNMIYFSLNTDNGKFSTQISPNKIGLRIARKYNLNITKHNKENNKPVSGATYALVPLDNFGIEVSEPTKFITTDLEGKLIAKDIYANIRYELREIKTPNEYLLNNDKIQFVVKENENKELLVEIESNNTFKNTPKIENDTLIAEVEDEPKYQVIINKKDEETKETLEGIRFSVENQQYVTDSQGQIEIKNLEPNKEYTLREVYSESHYLLDDIKFKLEKDENGQFKIISENESFANSKIEINNNEDLIKVSLELTDKKAPSITINKKDKETGEAIPNVSFIIDGKSKVYTTNSEGQVIINGIYENVEYTLKEIKADGYFKKDITFKVVKDENGNLKIESEDEEFSKATEIDKTKKMLSLDLSNEKIPTYNLQILKVEDGNTQKTLSGAKFQLRSEDLDTVKEYTTDENGCINISDLYAYLEGKNISGNYILQEISAPKGYCNNAEEVKFRVNKNQEGNLEIEIENKENLTTVKETQVEGNTAKITLKDKLLFTLTKTDSETGKVLANAKFVIYEVNENKEIVDFAKDINGDYIGTKNSDNQYEVVTDENGRISLPLKDGSYVITEIGYPEGYLEKDTVQYFDIKSNSNNENIDNEETNTESDYEEKIKIECIEDLVKLSKEVNEGKQCINTLVTLEKTLDFNEISSYKNSESTEYGDLNGDGTIEGIKTELTKESGTGFTPIGLDYNNNIYFSGTFDGKKNEIRNIYINNNSSYSGLFGCIGNASIINLGISGNINSTGGNVGGIAGYANNVTINNCFNMININSTGGYAGGILGASYNITINKCYNLGEIRNNNYAAGICADINGNGIITNCYNEGNIYGSSQIGGIAADFSGYDSIIRKCYNTGKLSGLSEDSYFSQIGGIVGELSDCKLIESYNTGEILANNGEDCGGIVGRTNSNSKIKNCYNTGNINIIGKFHEVGGISAYGGIITECYNIGNISCKAVSWYLGGIVGYPGKDYDNLETMKDCYNTGNISIIDYLEGYQNIGGIAGYGNRIDFDTCYNTGNINVVSNDGKIGGIVGYYAENISNCYNTGNINISSASYVYDIYTGGIVGDDAENISNCYNTGNILSNTRGTYLGGIAGNAENISNCYNTGNLIRTYNGEGWASVYIAGIAGSASNISNCYNKGYISTTMYSYTYAGGIFGSCQGATNCYNAGNIICNDPCEGNSYIGGVGGSGTLNNSYNIGNIKVFSRSEATAYVGKICGQGKEANNCYYSDSMEFTVETETPAEINEVGKPIAKENVEFYNITSPEFFNIINQDGVWTHFENLCPKLLIMPTKLEDSTQINIENEIKKFNITTDVIESDGTKGGTITGEGEQPFEVVKYGNENTKEIVMTPQEGYGISRITINGSEISYKADEETGSYTIPAGYLKNINEDKHISVTYTLLDQILKIDKVDEKGNKLKGASFEVKPNNDTPELENITANGAVYEEINEQKEIPIDGTLTANGTKYYTANQEVDGVIGELSDNGNTYKFVESDGKYISNNRYVSYSQANSYLKIDLTGKTGKYYVVVNAESSAYYRDYSYATIKTDNTSIPAYNDSEGRFIYLSGTNSAKDYTSMPLEGGNTYYLYFGYKKTTNYYSGSDIFTINSVKVYDTTEASYFFEKQDEAYVPNNISVANTVANSYIPIDLTGKTGKYMFRINAEIAGTYSDYLYATVTKDTTAPDYNDSNGRILCINKNQDAKDYISIPFEGGDKYYLHLGYKNYSGTETNKVKINSIKLYEEIDRSYNFDEVDGKYISNNVGKNNTYAYSYIPLDLTNCSGQYEVNVNAQISSSNNDYGFATVTNSEERPTNITNNKIIYMRGEQSATDGTLVLNGGSKYYIHLGYYNGNTGDANEDKFQINSISVKPVVNVITTDDNGEAKLSILPGSYKVTEIKAPDDYVLNSEPITVNIEAGKDNTITVTNKAKTKLIVHHYLKDKDGNYTTVKVAEDEVKEIDRGKEYSSAPKIDLNNLELEKDSNGNYVTPSNGTGTMENDNIEVTYYYQAKNIELTIHHYWNGSYKKLADDEKVEFEPEINIVDNKVESVNIDQKYEILSNQTYKKLIKDYKLELVTQDGKTINITQTRSREATSDEITCNDNSELTYYYSSEKEYKYTIEYYYDGELDESKTEELKVKYEDVIREYKDKARECYKFDRVENLPLVISQNESENVIRVYYVFDKDNAKKLNYTVEYYKDGIKVEEHTQKKIIDVLKTEPDTLKVDGSEINIKDKYVGHKLDSITIEKDGKEEVITELPREVDSGTTIKINYVKESYEYTVEYYYDGILDESQTESSTAKYGETIDKYTDKIKPGYKFEKEDNFPLTISTQAINNVIKVYYVLDDGNTKTLKYTVEYYKDGVKQEDDTEIESKTVQILEPDTLKVNIGKINITDKYVGYKLDNIKIGEDVVSEIPNEVTNNSVIKVNYVKDSFEYTVEYYYDGTLDESKTEKAMAKYNEEITKYTDKNKKGYKLDKVVPTSLIISDNVENNIIKVYYIKDDNQTKTLKYTVEYYKDGKKQEKDTQVVEKKVHLLENDTIEVDKKEINIKDKYKDYSFDNIKKQENGKEEIIPEIPDIVTSGSIIKINYIRQEYTLTVKHIDKDTKEEIDVEKETKKSGENYETQAKKYDKYDVVETPENAKGTITKDEEVIYYYSRKTKVVVNYINPDDNKKVEETVVIEGHRNDDYKTEEKTIKYYKLDRIEGNKEGKMLDDTTTVTYYYKPLEFNLKFDKEIQKIEVNGVNKKITNGKLEKIEIYRKNLNDTDVKVSYKIKVINDSELAGSATITENIPDGFTMDASENAQWKIEGDTASIEVEEIKPKETKEYDVILTWKRGEENLGNKTNMAEISNVNNEANFKEKDTNDNISKAEVILTVSTGENKELETIIATITISLLTLVVIRLQKNKQ